MNTEREKGFLGFAVLLFLAGFVFLCVGVLKADKWHRTAPCEEMGDLSIRQIPARCASYFNVPLTNPL